MPWLAVVLLIFAGYPLAALILAFFILLMGA